MTDDMLTQLTSDGAAHAAAILTDAAIRLEISSGRTVDHPEILVLDTFKRFLTELLGQKFHAATIEQIVDHQS